MQHHKQGYILFLLFIMLSVCTVLISLFFSQTVIYNQLFATINTEQKATRLATSAINLVESLVNTEKKDQQDATSPKQATLLATSPKTTEQSEDPIKIFTQIFKLFNTKNITTLTSKEHGIDATVDIAITSEQGKLNLNSLYDFEKKQFLNQGTAKDKRKLCIWLFKTIATINKKPSLFEPFENFLKNRDFDLNDVTELMSIKEFAQAFENAIFINQQDQALEKQLALTDIFTINTEQETINPWLFSPSWQHLLQLKATTELSDEQEKKLLSSIAKTANWQSDWDTKLKDFYKKEYKDIPEEIKTILTTDFEANIFSLLLKANIAETNSSIFTIVKMKAKDDLVSFETLKSYQI